MKVIDRVLSSCIECQKLKNQLFLQLPIVREQAKQKAVEQNKTYGIYLDTEDKKFRCASVEECKRKSYCIVEYVSRHS